MTILKKDPIMIFFPYNFKSLKTIKLIKFKEGEQL